MRAVAEAFARRFNKQPEFVGEEAAVGWLANTGEAARLFGYPVVPLNRMIEWVKDWVERDLPTLNKPTQYETRSGRFTAIDRRRTPGPDAGAAMSILERPRVRPSAPAQKKNVPIRRDPARTRERILQAAIGEFSEKGLDGARVDEIARRSRANKRLIYHYFGNKAELFLAVLEHAYDDIRRAEASLNLDGLDPETAMRRLTEFSFDYSASNPHFIHLVNCENLYGARHLQQSKRILKLNSPVIEMLRRILDRGQREGVFRRDVDPLQLYVSIAALGYFYLSNNPTLSVVFGRDLAGAREVRARREHNVAVVLGFLKQRSG